MIKFTDEQQGKYDNALKLVQTSERATWEALNIVFIMAVSHVQDGGNIAVLNRVLKAPRLHSTRRALMGMAKKFLAFEVDNKACKLTKKAKNPKMAERKAIEWTEWLLTKQSIQAWINTNDAGKGKKELTPEQLAQRSDKAIEKALNDGVLPERMLAAILNHEGIQIGQLLKLLNDMAIPQEVAAVG